MKISSTVLLLIQYRFHIVFEPNRLRIACLRACLCAGRHAGRPVGRQAGWLAGRSAGRLAGQCVYVRTCLHSREPTRSLACKHSCGYNHSLMPSYTLISFLLLGSLGIGKRCFEIRNNSTNSNPFADGFLVLSKAQQGVLRVTRRLFGYCRKVAAARYVSSYSKPFGLLPKALPPGCSSEVGQPVYIEKEDIGLYPTSSLLVFLKSNLSPFG